jgi:hypothetical protein
MNPYRWQISFLFSKQKKNLPFLPLQFNVQHVTKLKIIKGSLTRDFFSFTNQLPPWSHFEFSLSRIPDPTFLHLVSRI